MNLCFSGVLLYLFSSMSFVCSFIYCVISRHGWLTKVSIDTILYECTITKYQRKQRAMLDLEKECFKHYEYSLAEKKFLLDEARSN